MIVLIPALIILAIAVVLIIKHIPYADQVRE